MQALAQVQAQVQVQVQVQAEAEAAVAEEEEEEVVVVVVVVAEAEAEAAPLEQAAVQSHCPHPTRVHRVQQGCRCLRQANRACRNCPGSVVPSRC